MSALEDGPGTVAQDVDAQELRDGGRSPVAEIRHLLARDHGTARKGFVLWYKRLEKERFPWPGRDEQGVVTMTGRELNWILDGIDVFRLRPHESLSYQIVA